MIPEVKIEKITIRGQPRRLGRRIVDKRSGFRKYVCFYPSTWTLEPSDHISFVIGADALEELIKVFTDEVERTRNG